MTPLFDMHYTNTDADAFVYSVLVMMTLTNIVQ
jgi:hypothetical protein